MILIDTNIVSELCRHRPARSSNVGCRDGAPFGISVVTIEEIHFGLSCKPNPRIETLLVRFFSDRCKDLPDHGTGSPAGAGTLRGQLRSLGRPRTQADMLIAATAQVHQLTLATRNAR